MQSFRLWLIDIFQHFEKKRYILPWGSRTSFDTNLFFRVFLRIFLQVVQNAGDRRNIDYFKTLNFHIFPQALEKWNFIDLYLCSLEIKEVGKCKIFQKKKNVANPCHDLNQQDCKVATQIFSGFVGGFGGRRDDVTLRLEGKDSSCAPARFGFHSRRASMSELIITEGA